MGWEVEGRFKREGTYVYLWLIHVDIWQKPIQYCKAIILQFKINLKNKKIFCKHEKKWNNYVLCGGFPGGSVVKSLPAMLEPQEMQV